MMDIAFMLLTSRSNRAQIVGAKSVEAFRTTVQSRSWRGELKQMVMCLLNPTPYRHFTAIQQLLVALTETPRTYCESTLP